MSQLDLVFEQLEGEEVVEIEEPGELITESDLKNFYRCPYSFLLKKHRGLTKVPKSAFAGQVMFFEQVRKKLFNLRDHSRVLPYQHRAGPELKMAEEMDREELLEYLGFSSPDAFGAVLFNRWNLICNREEFAGSPLAWTFKEQPFHGASDLQAAGSSYYKFVLDNGAPFFGWMNKRVSFNWEGLSFLVKFPELRKGFIDDPHVWSFNVGYSHDRNHKIDTSEFVTLRLLAYATLVDKFEFFKFRFGEGGFEDITYRHLNGSKNEISETRRKEKDLDRLKRSVDYFLEEKRLERFPADQSFCGSCAYNTVDLEGRCVCDKQEGGKPSVPMFYFKGKYEVIISNEGDNVELIGMVKRDEEIEKEVNRVVLSFDGDNVTSEYSSFARGMGFEEKMLQILDERLYVLASRKGELVHKIEFDRDFKFAGQKSILRKLEDLGYEDFEKIYK